MKKRKFPEFNRCCKKWADNGNPSFKVSFNLLSFDKRQISYCPECGEVIQAKEGVLI